MANFDWMESEDFRKEIDAKVSRTAAASGMEKYQPLIVDRLMSHLEEKRTLRIVEESRKTAFQQRTKTDALNAVQVLIDEASRIGKSVGRTTVTVEDFDKAYKAKFCMVWPFC